MFNLASMLIALKCYKLPMNNLNQIIIMVKNWLDDPYLNCSQHKDLTNFLKVEFSLAEDTYDLIEESNYFKQLELDND